MKNVILFFLSMGLLLSACTKNDLALEQPKDNPAAIVPTGFTLDIFKTIVNGEDNEKNVIISPLSIETAFLMAANGANGDTRKNILDVLGYPDASMESLNESHLSLEESLDYQGDTTVFGMANAVFWGENRINMKADYLDKMSQYFDADQQALDFGDPTTKDKINKWVADKTEDRIDKIIELITGGDIAFLINTLYFKGDWKYSFNIDQVADGNFTKSNGQKITVPFMPLDFYFPSYFGDDYSAIDLVFKNNDFSMTFLMPTHQSINDFINGLTMDELKELYASKLATNSVSIQMPKFELEYGKILNEPLQSMGMTNPFTPNLADFSNLGTAGNPICIGKALHKTFLKIDEKGAEGAAVTSIGMVATSGPSSQHFIKFDKPFLAILKNHKTDSYVFLAKVAEPE